MYVYIRLPDRPLAKGLVDYFDEHEDVFDEMNRKLKVVVPENIVKEIRQYVVVNLLGRASDLIQEMPSLEAETHEKEEATDVSQPEDNLYEEILSIDGIGKSTAQKVVDMCENDIGILRSKLFINDLDLREDYATKLKKHFDILEAYEIKEEL